MARRYRYAFAKKREAAKGKWSVGLAAASLVLFIVAVVLALFLDGKLGGLIWRNRAFCDAAVSIRLCTGPFQLFRGKPETPDKYDRIDLKRCDSGNLAGTFFIRSIKNGRKRTIKKTA